MFNEYTASVGDDEKFLEIDGLLVEMTYSISELKPGCWKCLLPHFGLKRETIYVQPSSTQNLRGPV